MQQKYLRRSKISRLASPEGLAEALDVGVKDDRPVTEDKLVPDDASDSEDSAVTTDKRARDIGVAGAMLGPSM
jgi:hypothetical protein